MPSSDEWFRVLLTGAQECCTGGGNGPEPEMISSNDEVITSRMAAGTLDEGEGPGHASSNFPQGRRSQCLAFDDYNIACRLAYVGAEVEELVDIAEGSRAAPKPKNGEKIQFSTGASYTGQWVEYARGGYGQMSWADGAQYFGEWQKNLPHGNGIFITKTKDTFVGQWQHGEVDGLGSYTLSDKGFTYRGQWKSNRPHGAGIQQWSSGCEYQGEFRDGVKVGFGVFSDLEGKTYSGSWDEDEARGAGCCVRNDGAEVRGDWIGELVHGLGTYTWPGGETYEGQFLEDKPHGFGRFTWPSGCRFEGYWKNGLQDGPGLLQSSGLQEAVLGDWVAGVQQVKPAKPPAV